MSSGNPFSALLDAPPIKALGKRLGVPQPARLRRGRDLPGGPIVLGGVAGSDLVADTTALLGLTTRPALVDDPATAPTREDGKPGVVSYDERVGAVLIDAVAASSVADLEVVRAALRPAVRGLEPSGRVIVVGADVSAASDTGSHDGVERAAAQQALEGLVRSIGKEARAGASANLVRVADDTTPADLASTLAFLLQGRSAYVSGQVLTVGHADTAPQVGPADLDPDATPFAGRAVVVTGAARGIGADIARTFAAAGAKVLAVDIPASGSALASVANEIGGVALQLDITVPEAGARIAEAVQRLGGGNTRIHAMVHNAGITRDKLFANTDAERWASVLEVNLAAEMRIDDVLLDPATRGGLAEDGRIVSVASTSGIGGNRGQANYAASKAGVVGMVRALAPTLAGGRTVNAVAPGFIETEMTGRIPLATREIGRRINSMQQGGRPVDVAETIAWFAEPASAAVNGVVLRVCGQSQLGA